MRVRLTQKSVSVDQELRQFIHDKLSWTLQKFAHRVRWVRILLEDTNGPRGGLDKRCVVSVAGIGLETVTEVRDADLRVAIASALRLSARSVVRAMERDRDGFGRPSLSRTVGGKPARSDASAAG